MASTKDLKKMSQSFLRDQGYYSGEIDGVWGKLSKKAYSRYSDYLKENNLEIGGGQLLSEDGFPDAVSGVVVIDPGHGGQTRTGGSSPNNATSSSGVLEKSMTLDLAKRIQHQLTTLSNSIPGSNLEVSLTRSTDKNLSLSDRAEFAETKSADVFLSIHFNGFNGLVRGTETLILSEANGNLNESEDHALAQRIQSAMFSTLQQFDANARDRGVKNGHRLGVLNDISLGNTRLNHETRACLAEVEFIDNPKVDELLNTGAESIVVLDALAQQIALAITEDLRANS